MQEWIDIDQEHQLEDFKKPIAKNHKMGIICSGNQSAVVPENKEAVADEFVMNDAQKLGHDTIDNVRVARPARDNSNAHAQPSITTVSMNRPEPLPRKSVLAKTNGSPAATKSSSTSSSQSNPKPSTSSANRNTSATFNDRFQSSSSKRNTSSIHTNSILFRGNEVFDPRVINTSAITNNIQNNTQVKSASRNSVTLTAFDTCKTIESPRSPNRNSFGTNLLKVRRRFGGSFQTLLNSTNNNNGGTSTVRSLSASENNLSVLSGGGKRKALAPKRFSTNSDYCPSVLFSRIANKRQEEKNLTLTRWKNYFMVNILRRKKDLNSRKT